MYKIDTGKMDKEMEKQTKRKEYLGKRIHREVAEFMRIQIPKGGFVKCDIFTTGNKTVREILESGMGFNINSAVTMKEVMYNILQIPVYHRKNGVPSLAYREVKEYAMDKREDGTRMYPIMWRYYQYKRCEALINKFLVPLAKSKEMSQ